MRKGLFFTMIAVVLSALFITSFTFYISYKESRQLESSKVRIITMNELVKSVENDMQRALYISSFRALLSLSDNVSTSGKFLNDTEKSFAQMLFNGTVAHSARIEPLMVNQTILNWSDKIMLLSEGLEVNLSLRIVNITISQDGPWRLRSTAYLNFTLFDRKRTAYWHRFERISATLPVENFEDPVYIVKTGGKIARRIVRSNITVWNISALRQHFLGKTYVAESDAPSFLKRLEGNLTPSPDGIETLVDTLELDVYDLEVRDNSSVDYLYWGSGASKNYGIKNITDKGYPAFQIDAAHLTFYNVLCCNYTT